MNKTRLFYTKYKHAIPALLYLAIYLIWFFLLERRTQHGYEVIHMAADDYIPFCEYFVIPYFLWFAYVTAEVIYFFFQSKEDYKRTCIFLFTGMTIFLIVSTLWPNGHHLRPSSFERDNLFTQLVGFLYSIDTPTNLWPSIHVYNSLGAHFAISRSQLFRQRRGIRIGSLVLCVSIILSTMFLKQHSVFDVLTAFVMAAVMYTLVYRRDILVALRTSRNKKTKPQVG